MTSGQSLDENRNNSTNDNTKITEANSGNEITTKNANKSDETAEQDDEFIRTRAKPENKTIKLKEKLNKENLDKEEWIQLSKLLGWNGFCESNSGTIYSFGKNTYILELPCNREGAYLGGYLFYFINENTLTSKLISFEQFEEDTASKKLKRRNSFYLIGESGFDEEEKILYFRHNYASAGQCGWEASYKFTKDKAVLTGFRAEWNCNPGTDFDSWEKLDLKVLRKKNRITEVE